LLRFASEVKALLADPKFPRRLNRAAIADFFWYQYVMGDKTYFEDIRLLPPASLLRCQDGRWTIETYWDVSYPDRYPQKPDIWYDRLIHDTLQAAVKRIVRPELRYGLSLSGGMDSRWIAIFLSQLRPDTQTFTFGPPESDDTVIARQVAKRLGLANQRVDLPATYVRDFGETIAYLSDGMYNLFEADEFPLSVQIGDHVDVAVGGMLGDLLFGHEMNPVSALLRQQDVTRYWLWRTQANRLPQPLMIRVFGPKTYQELKAMAMHSLEQCIAAAPSDRGFQIVHHVNLRHRQRRYINIAQLSKLAYVDTYHPLADSQVIQASLQLPPAQMMLERAYRRAMATYYPAMAEIPWTFALMPPRVSVSTVMLKKALQFTFAKRLCSTRFGSHPLLRQRKYFSAHTSWSRGPIRPFIEETLFSPETEAIDIFEPDGLRAVMKDHMEGTLNLTEFLGATLSIALWARLFYLPVTPERPACKAGSVPFYGLKAV
jgi:asparagine synthase (glutamine-hydrolysing)